MSAQRLHYLHDTDGNMVSRTLGNALPPQITGQPVNQIAALGDLVTFSVVVADARAITFQWKHDGTDIPGIIQDAVDRSVKAMVANFMNPVANPDFKQDYKGYLGTPSGTFKSYAPFTGVRANLVIDPNKFRFKPAGSK